MYLVVLHSSVAMFFIFSLSDYKNISLYVCKSDYKFIHVQIAVTGQHHLIPRKIQQQSFKKEHPLYLVVSDVCCYCSCCC